MIRQTEPSTNDWSGLLSRATSGAAIAAVAPWVYFQNRMCPSQLFSTPVDGTEFEYPQKHSPSGGVEPWHVAHMFQVMRPVEVANTQGPFAVVSSKPQTEPVAVDTCDWLPTASAAKSALSIGRTCLCANAGKEATQRARNKEIQTTIRTPSTLPFPADLSEIILAQSTRPHWKSES